MATVLILITHFVQAQNLNVERLGHFTYDLKLNDVWAYWSEDSTGIKEYALVGVNNGLSIVDVTEPTEPVELHFIEGVVSTWRDMKTYNGFAYVSNETGDGILIVNLNNLPDEAPAQNFTGDDNISFTTAHNVFIDEFGILYVIGPNYGNGGCIMYDTNKDPLNPEYVGIYDDTYVHDAYARNNKLYTSEINDGTFSIIDISDKSNLVVLGNASTPNNFTHNCWLSDDENTLFTTDEKDDSFIGAYDISDPNDIKELGRVQSNPGSGVVPHNTHVLNNYLITSYYKDGVTIHDATNPSLMVEVGNFDTAPNLSGGSTDGCWGATPFLPSGNILATDINEGLFILKPTYKRATFLTGLVNDTDTNEPLSDVTVTILDQSVTALSNLEGNYITGFLPTSTTAVVQFSKPRYETRIDTIELLAQQTDTLNVSLQAQESFSIKIDVFDDNEEKIPDAVISIVNDSFKYDEKADETGTLFFDEFYEGTYQVLVGKWGYQTLIDTIKFDSLNRTYNTTITKGYYDDFALDFGWQVSGNATTGIWERGEPNGTTFGVDAANPGEDATEDDLLNICYVTGNGGGSAPEDDIDNGNTVLTSPVFDLSNEDLAILNYSRWFYNGGGQGTPPNDMLTIYLTNGSDTTALETINNQSEGNSSWQQKTFNLNEAGIELTANMTLIAETADIPEGHLVEAGFDYFYITDIPLNIIDNQYNDLSVQLSENPFTNEIQLILNDAFQKLNNSLSIQFISVDGKVIETQSIKGQNISWGSQVPKGIYQYVISHKEGYLYSGKLIKL